MADFTITLAEIDSRGVPMRIVDLGDGSFALKVIRDPFRGAITDRSGSITTAATSQLLAPANGSRQYIIIQNISVENLWIDFGVDAVQDKPSIRLEPGDSFVMEDEFISTDSIHIIGATAGSKFVAKEG